MNSYPLACDIHTLRKIESTYQIQLEVEPSNLDIRLDLAWCLFMQALHEAGRESLRVPLPSNDQDLDRAVLYREIRLFEQKSYTLLKSCLRETFTIMQLSPITPKEVSKLHTLIRLSGAGEAFAEAEDEAMKVLARIGRDIVVMQTE